MTKDECEDFINQKQMIKNFVDLFYKRYGYKPVVVSKTNDLETVSLEQLKEYFEPFLPTLLTKVLRLDKKCRVREIIELRQMYCYIARLMGYRLISIGKSLKQADHSTVFHSIRSFRNLMETDYNYKQKFVKIFNYIKQKINESSTMADSNKVENNP